MALKNKSNSLAAPLAGRTMWGVRLANGNWHTDHPAFALNGTPNPYLASVFTAGEESAKAFAARVGGTAEIIKAPSIVR